MRRVGDQDEQLGPTFDRLYSCHTFKCFVHAAKRAALEYNIEHMQCCKVNKSVVNVNTNAFSYFPTNMFSAEHVRPSIILLYKAIDLFRGAVKGNVPVAGHVKRVDRGDAFDALTFR